ncbi:MAG: HlyD family efflux transporter periplasmic adaptor subunit [Planctomycetota bacterium]
MDERSQQTQTVPSAEIAAAPASRGPSSLEELRSFFDHLLDQHCRLTDADAAAVFLLSARAESSSLFSTRLSPTRAVSGELRAAFDDGAVEQALVRVAKLAVSSSGGVAGTRVEPVVMASSGGLYTTEPTHRAVATPLIAEGRVQGATLALLPGASGDAGEEARLIELANQRFETFLLAKHARTETEQKLMLRQTLELLDRGQQAESAGDMASVLCDELAQRFRCTRASLGMVEGDEIRVKSISAAPQLDRRTALSESLERVMEECAQQDTEILYPVPEAHEADAARRLVVREHERFFVSHGHSSLMTLPLRVEGDLVGVVVLERESHDPFPESALPLVRLAAEFVGPAIFTRRLADRGLKQVARDRAGEIAETLVGPRHTGWKLLAASVAAAFVLLAAVPIPSRVVSSGEVSAEVVRSVTPGFAGFLAEVRYRPGDRVAEGDLMATLDTREMRLRLSETEAQAMALETERDDAYSRGEPAEGRKAEARLAETRAAIGLLRLSLDKAELRAPLSGVVSGGDLEHAAGSRVEPAKALFEVVGDGRRVVLDVGERDIGRVEVGDEGWVVTRSDPGRRLPVRVLRINPSSDAGEGNNTFRVEAELIDPERDAPLLSPGTRVTSRLRDGWTTGLAELSRPIVDEIRLRLWW